MTPGEPARLPGYREVYKTPEQERSILSRTRKYAAWLTEPMERKGRLNQEILADTEEPLDLDELGRIKLFEFGKGFPGHPPPEYSIGEEPPTAPMSQEQIRLLLVRVVPPAMIPFINTHFILDYDLPDPSEVDGPPAQPSPGPTVRVMPDGKVKITFYRDNFFTQAVPPHLRDKKDRESKLRARHIAGFVDPSKIAILFGQIMSHMIPPPPNWDKIVDKKFHVTKQLTDKKKQALEEKKGSRQEQNETKKRTRLERQWADFVGLALAAPDLARQQYPEAYDSFLASVEGFSNVKNDPEAIKRLLLSTNSAGILQLAGSKIDYDVRTEDQKLKDKGIAPEIAAYERFIAGINNSWAMRILGRKIVYDPPQDLIRTLSLAEDEAEIKKIMESSPEETMRDMDFGEVLSISDGKDLKARNKARRYLMAASQNGEFAEWRIYAWLFKFSETFTKSQGRNISDTDYKDLQLMIYGQSEKLGNRIGTTVLPFEAIPLTAENYPGAQNFGRKMYFYVRKDRATYIKEVDKKVKAKSPKAVLTASQDAFKHFKTQGGRLLDFDEVYNSNPEGMSLPNGSLDQFLGESFAKEYSQWLQQAGVTKVPADAMAIASVWFKYYKDVGRNWNDPYLKAANQVTRDVILHYADKLNQPPEEEAKELFSQSAEEIAESGNPEHIATELKQTEVFSGRVLDSIGVAADRDAHLATDTKNDLLAYIEDGQVTDTTLLLKRVGDEINRRFKGNPTEAATEHRNLLRFLLTPEVQRNLALYSKAQEREKKLVPTYTFSIEKASADLTRPETVDNVIKPLIDEPELAVYEQLGIKLTEGERKAIEEAGIITTEEPAAVPGAPVTAPTEPTVTAPPDADLQRAERSKVLRQKIEESPDEVRQRIIIYEIGNSLEGENSLDHYLAAKRMPTYAARYADWLKSSGRIFNVPGLEPARKRLESAVRIMDISSNIRLGLEEKNAVVESIRKSANYVKYRLDPKKKPAPTVDITSGEDETTH